MEKFFIICGKRLVKGVTKEEEFYLASEAYEFVEGSWKEINVNEINDRLMGYDPTEDDFYAMGNTEIMDEIEEISESDIEQWKEDIK